MNIIKYFSVFRLFLISNVNKQEEEAEQQEEDHSVYM